MAPVALLCRDKLTWAFHYAAVRIRPGSIAETVRHLETKWAQFLPGLAMGGWFLDDDFDALYREEERLGWLLAAAAGLAIAIACLGVFALSANAAEQRTREIGVRKALGGTVASIVTLLGREIATLALLANLLAWPLTWWGVSGWLDGFAYQADQGVVPYAAAGVGALVAALAATGYQALKAARSNPVDALRNE